MGSREKQFLKQRCRKSQPSRHTFLIISLVFSSPLPFEQRYRLLFCVFLKAARSTRRKNRDYANKLAILLVSGLVKALEDCGTVCTKNGPLPGASCAQTGARLEACGFRAPCSKPRTLGEKTVASERSSAEVLCPNFSRFRTGAS